MLIMVSPWPLKKINVKSHSKICPQIQETFTPCAIMWQHNAGNPATANDTQHTADLFKLHCLLVSHVVSQKNSWSCSWMVKWIKLLFQRNTQLQDKYQHIKTGWFWSEFLLARECAVLMMDWSEFLYCPNGLQDNKSLTYKFVYI